MNVLAFQNHCCGCGECFAVCPTKAIIMKKNEQGFLYPVIDNDKCVDCSKCARYCSFNKKGENCSSVLESYAMKHKNEEIRANSRSGGIFTALSDFVLSENGSVFGCVLKDNREAVHVRATSPQERDLMRGSKYIQSDTKNVFQAIKSDLEQGKWVLFSGTSCQVNAVKDFCATVPCERLLLVDIVCHGVPSPMVWSDYLNFLEKKENKKIVDVDFRDKKNFGWAAHKDTVIFDDGSQYSGDVFTKLFYGHNILRKACFGCPYRNLNRVGDISIADCWGIATEYPEFDDNKGVSLVIVNTLKGKEIYKSLSGVNDIEVDINRLMQPPLKENWTAPKEYDEFWKYYHKHSFKNVVDKYVYNKPNFFTKVKNKTTNFARRVYRKLFKRK